MNARKIKVWLINFSDTIICQDNLIYYNNYKLYQNLKLCNNLRASDKATRDILEYII